MAGNNLKREIVITANGKGAESVLTVLKKHMKDLHDQMAQLEKDGKANTKEYRELQTTYKQLDQQTKQQTFEFERYDKVMRNLSGSSVRQLRQALKALKKEMELYSSDDPHLDILRNKIKAVQDQINEATGAVKEHGNSWKGALKGMVAFAAGFEVLDTLKDKLQQVIEKTFEFGDAQANVKKVTGLNDKGIADLSNRLAKLDTRTTLTDLQNLAYEGGKLGIGQYGVQGLESYVRAANQIKVALGDDLGEDAMLPLAKMGEVMGLFNGTAESVEKGILQIGSAINELTQSSASSAGAIVDFGSRVQGMAAYLKLSTADMLALGSAADAAGLSMETSGTAFSMFLSALQKSPGAIEKALKIEDGTINQLVNSGKTMDAILLILDKMKEAGNMHNLEDAFKALGSEGARMVGVLATMSQKVDMVREHVDVSRKAFKEATSVTNEYNVQNETAAAIMERANNMWEKAFVNPNGIDAVKEMANVWYNFSKELTQSKPFLASVKILFWGLKTSVEALLFVLPGLLAYLGTRGLVMAFSKLIPLMIGIKGSSIVSFFTLLTRSIMGSHIATLRLIVSWKQLSLAMKTNIIGLVISVVTSLGVAIYDLVKKTNEASSSVQRFNRSFQGVRSAANHAVAELDAYYGAIKRAKKGSNEYQAAMKTYVDKFGMYFKKLKDENGMVKNLAESYRQAAKAIRGKIYLQMQEDDIQKHYKPRIGWSLDKLDAYGKVAPKGFGTDVLKGYEEDNRNKNMGTIIADLARRYGSKNVARVLASEKEGRSSAQVRKVYKDTLGDGTVHQYVKYEDLPIEDQRLFSALRYIRQARSANNVFDGIKNKFAGAQDEISDYLKDIDAAANEDLGGGGGGKGGYGGGGKNTPKTDNTAKQEEQKAKTRANALIANIKAFYEEQMRKYLEWVTQMNADGKKISEGQQKEQMDYLQSQMDLALGKAYQSIATLDTGFQEFFQHMDEDVMVYDDETSKRLLESIGKADIEGLHKLFTKLSGDLSRENNKTLAENLGALLDQQFANGSKKLREAAEKLLARQREIQKILNEHDYTGAVNRNTRSEFDRLGFLQPAKDIRSDSPEGLEKMNAAFDKLTTKARESITILYSLNPESENFQSQFLDFLSVANEGFDFSKLKAQDLKALYLELLKYNDEYESASKKRDDERKKLNDYGWSKDATQKQMQATIDYQQKQNKETSRQYSFGAKGDTILPWEQTEATDPELALLKLKFDLAKEYYKYIEEHGAADEQKIAAAKQIADAHDAIMDSVAAKAKATAEAQMKWYKPIEEYGSALGEALTDESKTVKDATKSMINSFIDLTGEYVKQKLTQWVMTKLYNSLMADSEKELVVERQVAAVEDAQTSVAKAGVDVAAGTASGAAKTIGTLGWWGIPLIAVIGAVLGGLLSLAKGALSDAFGGNKNNNDTKRNFKVTSGMLTYDSGNVQDLRPFVGNDGSLYWATEDSKPHDGVSLLTQPTATTINGQPSLVAENGPELVIGRETTRAMMMNNPQLLKA
ncbi:MAG: phage tail tape measure protein, partial [Prevotella sp.]|nr:phage tail tape measure protein [Prevotella sp.]